MWGNGLETAWHEKHADKFQEVTPTGCWVWTACLNKGGYAWVSYKGRASAGHRVAYTETYGRIPIGLMVRHKCGVRACVRPDHLQVGTAADNGKDTSMMFRTPSSLNIDQVRGIRSDYDDGLPLTEIAKKYDIAAGSVYPIVCYQNFPHVDPEGKGMHKMRSGTPRKTTQSDVDEVLRLRASGMLVKDIMLKTGISHSTYYRILSKQNV